MKTIFKCKVGSHLYGLNTPESDIDYYSVFIPTSEQLLGLEKVEEIDRSTKNSSATHRNTADDVDDKAHSLPKFMHLVLQNNPNIVEVLFAKPDLIEVCEPEFKTLMDNYDKIISQRVFHTFTGYAFSQKKKLTVKAERYGSLCESVNFLEKTFSSKELGDSKRGLTEKESSDLNRTLKYYKGQKGNCESFHKGMPLKTIYEKIVEERDNYGWRVKTTSFNEVGFDVKFGYHLVRILLEGHLLLNTGKLEFPLSGEHVGFIKDVKSAKVSLEELLNKYNELDKLCKSSKEMTTLRKSPDYHWANEYLISTLKNSIMNE